MSEKLGRALESINSLSLTGRTWDPAFEREPEDTESAMVIEPPEFPDNPHGTIVI